jgi:hypothetical protein
LFQMHLLIYKIYFPLHLMIESDYNGTMEFQMVVHQLLIIKFGATKELHNMLFLLQIFLLDSILQ